MDLEREQLRAIWICAHDRTGKTMYHLATVAAVEHSKGILPLLCTTQLPTSRLGPLRGETVCGRCAAFAIEHRLNPPFGGKTIKFRIGAEESEPCK